MHVEVRARHRILAGLLLAVCLMLAPSPAFADTWGLNDGESGAEPDNSTPYLVHGRPHLVFVAPGV